MIKQTVEIKIQWIKLGSLTQQGATRILEKRKPVGCTPHLPQNFPEGIFQIAAG